VGVGFGGGGGESGLMLVADTAALGKIIVQRVGCMYAVGAKSSRIAPAEPLSGVKAISDRPVCGLPGKDFEVNVRLRTDRGANGPEVYLRNRKAAGLLNTDAGLVVFNKEIKVGNVAREAC